MPDDGCRKRSSAGAAEDTMIYELGDIFLVEGSGFVPDAIKWWSKSRYSHAMLYIGELHEQHLVIEAGAMGVWINTLARHIEDGEGIDCYRVKAPLEYRSQTPAAAMTYISKRYGFEEIAGFAIALATGLRANPFGNADSLFCSELIDLAYLGLWSNDAKTTGLVSPQTIATSQYVQLVGRVSN